MPYRKSAKMDFREVKACNCEKEHFHSKEEVKKSTVLSNTESRGLFKCKMCGTEQKFGDPNSFFVPKNFCSVLNCFITSCMACDTQMLIKPYYIENNKKKFKVIGALLFCLLIIYILYKFC